VSRDGDSDPVDGEGPDSPPADSGSSSPDPLSGIDFGDHRSGFVAIMGRPNVGKSTLVNAICGDKVAITSDKPQTTRHQIRGVLTRDDAQVVFVDTPGIHKPRTVLGERLNVTAAAGLADVDAVCLVIDATAPLGPGDRFVAAKLPPSAIVVVNKCDAAGRDEIVAQLAKSGELGFSEYFPVSARTGEGVETLVEHLVGLMPPGPKYYPDEQIRDMPEPQFVAELVREQLLRVTHDEVPHSIATRVTEWEWPRIRVEILVERESQKGIVIGHKGSVLKKVGTAVREQLPEGAYLELQVNVDKDWQRRPDAVERILDPGDEDLMAL
jgi:GTP-binding protein Era